MTDRLTPEQRFAITAGHYMVPREGVDPARCDYEAQTWPCHAITLLRELEAVEAERDVEIQLVASYHRTVAQLNSRNSRLNSGIRLTNELDRQKLAAEARVAVLEGVIRVIQASPIVQDDDGACWFCLAPYSHPEHSDDCPYSPGLSSHATSARVVGELDVERLGER